MEPAKSHDVLSTGPPKEADSLGFEGSSVSPIGIAVLRGSVFFYWLSAPSAETPSSRL